MFSIINTFLNLFSFKKLEIGKIENNLFFQTPGKSSKNPDFPDFSGTHGNNCSVPNYRVLILTNVSGTQRTERIEKKLHIVLQITKCSMHICVNINVPEKLYAFVEISLKFNSLNDDSLVFYVNSKRCIALLTQKRMNNNIIKALAAKENVC